MNLPHISTTVSKLGASIPCINLPPVITCRPDAPCVRLCYARKGRFSCGNVKKSLAVNLEIYMANPDFYFGFIDMYLKNSAFTFFRWHSSGDIPDERYLSGMNSVAASNPDIRFLCFTKKYELINNFIESGNTISKNLKIVFSVWGDFPCPNPHNLPCAYVRLKNTPCIVPVTAHECPGNCASCSRTENSCWSLHRGESVVFRQH